MGTMAAHLRLIMVCTVLWTLVAAMAVGGTARNDIRMLIWAVLVALVACMVSAWFIALAASRITAARERVRLETLAQIMATCAADNTVESIR